MDDYSIDSLNESKNEWCARLLTILTPEIIKGLKSIFKESCELCLQNEEEDKYLMTFQTFLSRIPQWNQTMIENERKRIEESSKCGYLEDLVSCVHIIHLKSLTCVRVGEKQKKVDIDIPSIESFIHKIYINVARKIYTNIYLFEKNIAPLQIQRHNRELELIIKECILDSIRDTIPVDTILRAYIDNTVEEEVKEEIIEEKLAVEKKNDELDNSNEKLNNNLENDMNANPVPDGANDPKIDDNEVGKIVKSEEVIKIDTSDKDVDAASKEEESSEVSENTANTSLKFSDIDSTLDETGAEEQVEVSKDIQAIEERNEMNFKAREEDGDDDDDDESLKIGEDVSLDIVDVNNLNTAPTINENIILDDIEVLE
jgi:hypothetical protein